MSVTRNELKNEVHSSCLREFKTNQQPVLQSVLMSRGGEKVVSFVLVWAEPEIHDLSRTSFISLPLVWISLHISLLIILVSLCRLFKNEARLKAINESLIDLSFKVLASLTCAVLNCAIKWTKTRDRDTWWQWLRIVVEDFSVELQMETTKTSHKKLGEFQSLVKCRDLKLEASLLSADV